MSSVPTIPAVPYGQPPTSTPTVMPPQGSFVGPQGDQVQTGQTGQSPVDVNKILQMILSRQQQPQLAQPVPSPIHSPGQMQPVQGRGSAGGNLVEMITGGIQGAVANKKKSDLAKAESDWNQFNATLQSGGPQAGQLWLASNDKAAKNMAKALNQDWLNPEKTTVYKQALDNVMKQQQAKGKAATGLKAMMQKLIGKAQNPQLTDAQKMQIAQEQMSKAPLVTPGLDPKDIMPVITEGMREKSEAATQTEISKREAATQAAETARTAATQATEDARAVEQRKSDKAIADARNTTELSVAKMHEHSEDLRAGVATMTQTRTTMNDTINSLRSQATLVESDAKSKQTNLDNLRSQMNNMRSQHDQHWIVGPGASQVSDLQSQIDAAQKSVDEASAAADRLNKAGAGLNAQRGAVLKAAKADPMKAADMMDDLTQKANETAFGTPAQAPTPSGAAKKGTYNLQTGQIEWH